MVQGIGVICLTKYYYFCTQKCDKKSNKYHLSLIRKNFNFYFCHKVKVLRFFEYNLIFTGWFGNAKGHILPTKYSYRHI